MKRKCIVTFLGTLIFALSIMIGYVVFPQLPEDSFLRNGNLGSGIGVIGVVGPWGIVIRERHRNSVQER